MSGIEESEYQILLDRVDLLDHLELIHMNQFKQALAIRNLPGLSEQTWEYYRIAELEGLKEIKLWVGVMIRLHKAMKGLISYANRKKPPKGNSVSVPVQSKGTGTDETCGRIGN